MHTCIEALCNVCVGDLSLLFFFWLPWVIWARSRRTRSSKCILLRIQELDTWAIFPFSFAGHELVWTHRKRHIWYCGQRLKTILPTPCPPLSCRQKLDHRGRHQVNGSVRIAGNCRACGKPGAGWLEDWTNPRPHQCFGVYGLEPASQWHPGCGWAPVRRQPPHHPVRAEWRQQEQPAVRMQHTHAQIRCCTLNDSPSLCQIGKGETS